MVAPILTPSLARLRTDFNTRCPQRDTESDGWIGDRAHQETTSGHNADDTAGSRPESTDADNIPEVRALDVDADLRTPGLTMLKVVQAILADPKALSRLRYIIFNRVIWSRTTGWQPRQYNGPNPHDKHAHFSGDPDDDANRAPWPAVLNAGEEDMAAPTQAEFNALMTGYATLIGAEQGTESDAVRRIQRLWAATTGTDVVVATLTAGVPVQIDINALALAIVAKLPPTALTKDDVRDALADVLTSGTNSVPQT